MIITTHHTPPPYKYIYLSYKVHKEAQKTTHVYSLVHHVHHELGDGLIAEQTGPHQQVIFVRAGRLPLDKVKDVAADGQQRRAIVAKIFDDPADRRCWSWVGGEKKPSHQTGSNAIGTRTEACIYSGIFAHTETLTYG